jgi:hypothetical protein
MLTGRVRNLALAATVLALIAVAGAGIYYWKYGRGVKPGELLVGLPVKDGAVFFLDVRALRIARVLDSIGGVGVAEEPDYKAFVAVTKFNYRDDLDAVAASYQAGDLYAMAAGRFDWPSLRNYALTQSGKCADEVCTMPSSQPGRNIAYFLSRPGVLALVVSSRPDAVAAFRQSQPAFAAVSKQPVWFSFPGSFFKGDDKSPAGTRLFAKILENAQRVNFAFGLNGTALELTMDALCASSSEAESALNQFDGVTEVVRKYLARLNQKPSPKELAGVLTNGVFRRDGSHVLGVWPIDKGFLETMGGGTK